MKKFIGILVVVMALLSSCANHIGENTAALNEQQNTEENQRGLNEVQPPPKLTWSLERDNLIKRFLMMNDRAVMFYMYVFIEGCSEPVGYYQINKVSSVNSQLTNTQQIVTYTDPNYTSDGISHVVLPSPAEDGSYGENGAGVFGFTPEDIYIEHNMKYIVSSVPLNFQKPVNRLNVISVESAEKLKLLMDKINKSKEENVKTQSKSKSR